MKRFALKTARDLSEPAIVEALEKAGFEVFQELPCDLIVWRPDKGWQLLDAKTPTSTGKRRKRKDQEAQEALFKRTNIPVALDGEAALKAVGAI